MSTGSSSTSTSTSRSSSLVEPIRYTREGQFVNLVVQSHVDIGWIISVTNKSTYHIEIEIKLGNLKCIHERTTLLSKDTLSFHVDNQLLVKYGLWSKPEYRIRIWLFGNEKENFRILRKDLTNGDFKWEIEGVKVATSKYGVVKLSRTLPNCYGCLLFEVQLLRKKGLINVINNCDEELTIFVKGGRLRLEAVLSVEENVPFYFDLPKQRLIYEFKVTLSGVVSSQFVLCGDILTDSTLDYKLMDKELFFAAESNRRVHYNNYQYQVHQYQPEESLPYHVGPTLKYVEDERLVASGGSDGSLGVGDVVGRRDSTDDQSPSQSFVEFS